MALAELSLSSLSFTVDHYRDRVPLHAPPGSPPEQKFILDAPYQRGSVWTVDQRRALIKSLLMGLPIGSVIIAALPYKEGRPDYRVIDGKQRIETVRSFYADGFSIPAHWLTPEDRTIDIDPTDYTAGVTHSEMSQRGQRRLDNKPMPCLQYDSSVRWVLDPTHPEAKRRNSPYRTERRNEGEMLAAEAEVYGLINGGGTPQTAADMANAAELAKGSIG